MSIRSRARLALLATRMAKQSRILLPVTPKLVEMLETIIEPAEADALLALGTRSRTRAELPRLWGRSDDATNTLLDALLAKALVLRRDGDGEGAADCYELTPMFVGWGEIVLTRGGADERQIRFARQFEEYLSTLASLNVAPLRPLINFLERRHVAPTKEIVATVRSPSRRTVPVGAAVTGGDSHVHAAGTIFEYLDRLSGTHPFAAMHCFCRRRAEINGHSCHFKMPTDNCLLVGHVSRQAIEYGVARPITKGLFQNSMPTADESAGHLAAFVLPPSVAVALLRLGRSVRARSRSASAASPSFGHVILPQALRTRPCVWWSRPGAAGPSTPSSTRAMTSRGPRWGSVTVAGTAVSS